MDMTKLMTRYELIDAIYGKWNKKTGVETVSLSECSGRVLAENIVSKYNIPVVRSSRMDGVALKSELFKDGMPDMSEWTLGNEFVRADTGDDFDDAYDCVVAIEMVKIGNDGKGLSIDQGILDYIKPNFNVAPSGSSLMAGQIMAIAGERIRPEMIASIAMSGVGEVKVMKKPVVAFIPTGSELVPAGSELMRGQNFDSNSLMAGAMIRDMGAEPLCYEIVKDKKEQLSGILKDALSKADIVVINGGSSKGSEDFNTHILAEEGDLITDGVRAVPGRPMTVAIMEGKPVINLSGPSLAAYYGIDWCIRSLVCSMLNQRFSLKTTVLAEMVRSVDAPGIMEMLMRVNVKGTPGHYYVEPVDRNQGAGAVMSTNAQIVTPIGCKGYEAGQVIEVELCCRPDEIPQR